MALIVSILSFMMDPGSWGSGKTLFSAMFNPIYLPQLLFRTSLAMVLGAAAALIVVAWHSNAAERAKVTAFVATIGGVAVLNGLVALLIEKWPRACAGWVLLLQMILDLAALSVLLYLSGGCNNPFSALLYLHAALGPLLLRRRLSGVYLLAMCTAMTFVCLNSTPTLHAGNNSALLHKATLAAELSLIVIIWGLVQWFSTSFSHLRSEFAALQRQRQRTDHLRALGAMSASFSHEFSTPLNTAKVRLDRLQRRRPELVEDLDLIASQDALEQCEDTIRGLFGADLQAGDLKFDEVDLAELVQQVCSRWQLGRDDADISFASRQGNTPLICNVPQVVLARSIIDVLDNALDASKGDRAAIEVEVAVEAQHVTVSISDRGSGVPKMVKDQLGKPFLSTRAEGLGLGLYTVHSLMEALGGALCVSDRPFGGATIKLMLPIRIGAPI